MAGLLMSWAPTLAPSAGVRQRLLYGERQVEGADRLLGGDDRPGRLAAHRLQEALDADAQRVGSGPRAGEVGVQRKRRGVAESPRHEVDLDLAGRIDDPHDPLARRRLARDVEDRREAVLEADLGAGHVPDAVVDIKVSDPVLHNDPA